MWGGGGTYIRGHVLGSLSIAIVNDCALYFDTTLTRKPNIRVSGWLDV